MTAGDDSLDGAVEATLTASRALLGVVARSVGGALEVVSLPQFRVLVLVASEGPLRIGTLAQRMGAVPSTFSRTIDRMADGGWVVRQESPQSRREILVDLTDDDRAALFGAFLGLADMLKGEGGEGLVEVWRRRGRKVFEAEQ